MNFYAKLLTREIVPQFIGWQSFTYFRLLRFDYLPQNSNGTIAAI